ncbi:NADP oxidoreductase [Hymenobacter busanensis]|uniref:NADP oxidoreductase n=1 Tax=Hymenobacter busanensis TaxID=2607656 RepID=A0A7L4ZY57_9BACT|nr:NAD(P)-binding domain-containing protein [Hymenobacter busanensis]KAA9339075.1 NADP oxidoreductase [Hymenobacter busanensis]QHJ07162.1 NAD(P)-binding domain-containing protein [Hymenobacter busanensis]
MKIGILGTGTVGQTLGAKLLELGHGVLLGGRSATNEKAQAWAAQQGGLARAGSFEDAAVFGELVIVATLGSGTIDAVQQAGPERLAGKTVIDLTNPLDFSRGMPPTLFVGHTDSLGEQIQRALPAAHVVKTLNIVSVNQMINPASTGGEPDMLLAGNDAGAKQRVTELLQQLGWKRITDLGGIEEARVLEPLVLLWVRYGLKHNTWGHALQYMYSPAGA